MLTIDVYLDIVVSDNRVGFTSIPSILLTDYLLLLLRYQLLCVGACSLHQSIVPTLLVEKVSLSEGATTPEGVTKFLLPQLLPAPLLLLLL